jgi:hypothetical protein
LNFNVVQQNDPNYKLKKYLTICLDGSRIRLKLTPKNALLRFSPYSQ